MSVLSLVEKLEKAGILFVAFDFDDTIVSIHTGGRIFVDDLERLCKTVSSDFVTLVKALDDKCIAWGVASFSAHKLDESKSIGGEPLIRKVLESCLGKDRASKVPIASWYSENGKNEHMKQLAPYLNPQEVVLIDDHANNLVKAKMEGFRTLWVKKAAGLVITELGDLDESQKKIRIIIAC